MMRLSVTLKPQPPQSESMAIKNGFEQRGLVFNGVIVANIGLVQSQAQEQNAQSGNGLQEYDTADVFRREVP